MRVLLRLSALGIASVSLLASCGGGAAVSPSKPAETPNTAVTCPPPPPIPTPIPAWLSYPRSGSTNVAVSIGEIIEKGASAPGEGVTITVASPTGNVPLGTPTMAPSPYPTPFATTPPTYGLSNLPYMTIPLPTLSPSTAYTVSDAYTGWADNPPQCSAQYSQAVGTFTTGQ